MQTITRVYYQGEQEFHGYLAYQGEQGKRPGVIVAHDWSGRNAFACQKAELFATMGYVGFAVDMYGAAKLGETTEEKQALSEPLFADRRLIQERMLLALDTLRAQEMVDSNKIAAIGFCFGGLCVLDLARSGADMLGVVSFHGLLNKPEKLDAHPVKAKVLAVHGYDDPMCTPDQVQLFCNEMTSAGADWQVHMYGNTQHAFTNPQAHDDKLGLQYNAVAERRSLQAMAGFLKELFA